MAAHRDAKAQQRFEMPGQGEALTAQSSNGKAGPCFGSTAEA